MLKEQLLTGSKLAALAKKFRKTAGKSRAEAARELKVTQTSIFQAEEKPQIGLVKLRMRMVEMYSEYKVVGPMFVVRQK